MIARELEEDGFIAVYEQNATNDQETPLIYECARNDDYLWVGSEHLLDREQVTELVTHLQYWLTNKRLRCDGPQGERQL